MATQKRGGFLDVKHSAVDGGPSKTAAAGTGRSTSRNQGKAQIRHASSVKQSTSKHESATHSACRVPPLRAKHKNPENDKQQTDPRPNATVQEEEVFSAKKSDDSSTTPEAHPIIDQPTRIVLGELESPPDSLLAVAQLYPWVYMTSQARMQHSSTQRSILQTLDSRAQELIKDGKEIQDSKIRFEAEKMLQFLDELNGPHESEVPSVFLGFLAFERQTSHAISRSIRFSDEHTGDDVSSFRRCSEILESVGELQRECAYNEERISMMKTDIEQNTKIHAILEAMLRVMKARGGNLSAASELMMVHKENIRSRLHIGSISLAV